MPWTMLELLLSFSSLSFLFFGLGCLTSPRLKEEFIRYRLPQYRKLTGLVTTLRRFGNRRRVPLVTPTTLEYWRFGCFDVAWGRRANKDSGFHCTNHART